MQVAVVGAGTMGTDIAHAVALGGCDVLLLDTSEAILRQALARISRNLEKGVRLNKINARRARRAGHAFTLVTDIKLCAPAELVIEAVQDDLALKKSVFQALDGVLRPETILATSTNTLSISALAALTRTPERFVGLHFCNPAHLMRLVEVVRAEQTRQDVIDRARAFVTQIGKTPVLVQDSPGLVVNRIGQMYYAEALRLLDDSTLDIQTVDRLMEAAGFPMGPFRLMDFVGVDTVYEVTRSMYEATFYEPRYRPHPRQRRMVDAGQVGRRNGRGFYPQD